MYILIEVLFPFFFFLSSSTSISHLDLINSQSVHQEALAQRLLDRTILEIARSVGVVKAAWEEHTLGRKLKADPEDF